MGQRRYERVMLRYVDNDLLTVEVEQDVGTNVIGGQIAQRPATQLLATGPDLELLMVDDKLGIDNILSGGDAQRSSI